MRGTFDMIIEIILLVTIGIVFLMICLAPKKASAHEIPKDQAVHAIIGEAENQGYKGMLAVACAIRNRGYLNGVYGLCNPRVTHQRYSPTTYHNALLAWENSKKDITHGATGWGTIHDLRSFHHQVWWKEMKVCFKYKDHIFYRKG